MQNNIKESISYENSVGVIIVNYNDAKRTLQLTENIITYSCIKNVIVVNNNSTDNSLCVLTEYNHPKFILCDSKVNGGYGFGNNIGIRKASELKCEYVLICNPDVVFDESTLFSMLGTLNSNKKCAIVNAKETYLNIFAWKYTNSFHDVLSASIILNKLLNKRYYKKSYFEGKTSAKVDIVQGSFLLLPTDLMLKHGMYDEEFFLYEEEKILYKKFKDAGYYSLTDLTVSYEHHHVDAKNITVKSLVKSKMNLLESKYKFLKKYRSFSDYSLFFSKIFFVFTILEMYLYGTILVFKNRIRRKVE